MEMQTLREIQENLLNRILVILAAVTIPVIFFFFLRVINTGWIDILYAYISIGLIIISIALLRRHIYYQIKTFFLVFLFFLLSTLSAVFFGLKSFFIPYMMLSILIAGIFWNKRTSIIVFLIGTVMFSVIGFLSFKGVIIPVITTSWVSMISMHIFIAALVIIAIGEIVSLLSQKISMLEKMNKELIDAGNEIKTLQGILPICVKCKNIRDDSGYWTQVESYIGNRADVKFSHGLCEKCADELYKDEKWYKNSIKK